MKKFLYPLAMGMLIGAGVAAIVYAKINKADKEKRLKRQRMQKPILFLPTTIGNHI